MGELERYGLLSLVSVLVLFLVLTFVGRDPEPREEMVRAVAAERDVFSRLPPEGKGVRPARESSPGVPAPPPAAPAAVHQDDQLAAPVLSHVVKRGETLSGIAQRYLGSARRWPELVAANAPLDPRKLRIGQVLRIPGPDRRARRAGAVHEPDPVPAGRPDREQRPKPRSRGLPVATARQHVVQKGDTLSGISNRYYGDYMQWKRIYQANRDRITNAGHLQVGTILTLP